MGPPSNIPIITKITIVYSSLNPRYISAVATAENKQQ